MIPHDEFAELVTRSRQSHDQRRGGNSTVSRLEWRGRQVAVKDYNARTDARARLSREWIGLHLLRSLGLRFVPEPLGADFETRIGAQEWLPGMSPPMDSATVAAMETVLCQLHKGAGRLQVGASCQPAADSIKDIADMREQILRRVSQLKVVGSSELQNLLNRITADVQIVESCTAETGHWIPTLSPSDFGPHNMLHDASKEAWNLIDLEFFGWDDAHKLICDTLLHPLIAWEGDLVGDFVETAARTYSLDPKRLTALFPWCSLKWATIAAGRAAREFCAGKPDSAQESIAKAHVYVRRAVESRRLVRDFAGLEAIVLWEPLQ